MKHILFILIAGFLFSGCATAQQPTIYNANGRISDGRVLEFLNGLQFRNINGAGYFRVNIASPSAPVETDISATINSVEISKTMPGDLIQKLTIDENGAKFTSTNGKTIYYAGSYGPFSGHEIPDVDAVLHLIDSLGGGGGGGGGGIYGGSGNIAASTTATITDTFLIYGAAGTYFDTHVGGAISYTDVLQIETGLGLYHNDAGGLNYLEIDGNGTRILNQSPDKLYILGSTSHSSASLASTPNTQFTGTWFTGGTATTTKPHVLIEPSGTTSTAWSTAGTGLGVNAASGFTGKLVDFQVNGVSKGYLRYDGYLRIGDLSTTTIYNSGIYYVGSSNATAFSAAGGLAQLFVGYNSQQMVFRTNSTEQMYLSSSGMLQFGGTTSSYPALKRSATTLETRLADDSGYAATQSLYDRFGAGTPEGAVSAPVGAVYHRTDGGAGTSFYVKESGTGNTGWIAK